jgi:exodeoxyribonuclease-3
MRAKESSATAVCKRVIVRPPEDAGDSTAIVLSAARACANIGRSVKIATWNVNSIKIRLDRVLRWIETHAPDVLCLQEIKVSDEAFPGEAFRQAGYYSLVLGQKTYNGVAIVGREEPEDPRRGLADDAFDAQARLVSAKFGGVRILSAYVPNGATVGSESWTYKLDWMERLRRYLETSFRPSEPLVLCGDLNVAPDDLDVASPEIWADTVLCHEDARACFFRWTEWGLIDAFRSKHPEGGIFSWWDYRQLAFPRNQGLRIDHMLVTEPLFKRCLSVEIDRQARKGKLPSDHAPVVGVFEDV